MTGEGRVCGSARKFLLRQVGEYDALISIESESPRIVQVQYAGYHTGNLKRLTLSREDYDQLQRLTTQLSNCCSGNATPFAWEIQCNNTESVWTNMPPTVEQTQLISSIRMLL